MAAAQTVKSESAEFIVRELTVSQVRAIIEDLGSAGRAPHPLELLFPGVPLVAVTQSCGIAPDALDSLSISDAERLITAVREVNPGFFSMHDRLTAAGRALMESRPSTDAAPG